MFQTYIDFFDNRTYVGAYIFIMVSICAISLLIMCFQKKGTSKGIVNKTVNVGLWLNVFMFFIMAPYLFYIIQLMGGLLFASVVLVLFITFSAMTLIKAYVVNNKNKCTK